mgnify:CR=1 FL=1
MREVSNCAVTHLSIRPGVLYSFIFRECWFLSCFFWPPVGVEPGGYFRRRTLIYCEKGFILSADLFDFTVVIHLTSVLPLLGERVTVTALSICRLSVGNALRRYVDRRTSSPALNTVVPLITYSVV